MSDLNVLAQFLWIGGGIVAGRAVGADIFCEDRIYGEAFSLPPGFQCAQGC